MKKYLIIGSAPSAKLIEPYLSKLNEKYDAIFAINNAWYLVKDIKFYWSVSTDFRHFGTYVPITPLSTINEYFNDSIDYHSKYDPDNLIPYGTMYLNTLYKIIYNSQEQIEIHVIGSDFDYSPEVTHFYGNGKISDNVREQLAENEPTLVNKAADPLRSGTEALVTLLNKQLPQNVSIYSLSPNPNQLLPYDKINIQDIFDE